MELVDGETLADRLRRGPLPLDEALKVARQIADALEAAPEGIIHRDVKPANVKITPAGTVKVLDFGLVKLAVDPGGDDVTLSAVTAPAVLLGTYMAAEQAEGRSVDRRVDLWAFGVVLYEMVTGERRFEVRRSRRRSRPFSQSIHRGRVCRRSSSLLRACLERDPLERLRDNRGLTIPADASAAAPARGRSAARSLTFGAAALAAVVLAYIAVSTPAGEGAPEPSSSVGG